MVRDFWIYSRHYDPIGALRDARATEELPQPTGLINFVFSTRDGDLTLTPILIDPHSPAEKRRQGELNAASAIDTRFWDAKAEVMAVLRNSTCVVAVCAEPPMTAKDDRRHALAEIVLSIDGMVVAPPAYLDAGLNVVLDYRGVSQTHL